MPWQPQSGGTPEFLATQACYIGCPSNQTVNSNTLQCQPSSPQVPQLHSTTPNCHDNHIILPTIPRLPQFINHWAEATTVCHPQVHHEKPHLLTTIPWHPLLSTVLRQWQSITHLSQPTTHNALATSSHYSRISTSLLAMPRQPHPVIPRASLIPLSFPQSSAIESAPWTLILSAHGTLWVLFPPCPPPHQVLTPRPPIL